MRYTLFLHYPEMTSDDIGDAAIEAGKDAFHRFAKALEDADVLVSAEVLQTATNTKRLAVREGRVQILDGPFVETKEQIGGTFVIEVPDLDAALAWAAKCPAAQWGTIEIRPAAVRFVDGRWLTVS